MTRRAYFNDSELILLEPNPMGMWVPAIKAMKSVLQGKVRIYLTDGDMVITHGALPLKWPLSHWDRPPGLPGLSIDLHMVYVLSEKDIHAFEAWLLNPVEGTRWDAVRRPIPVYVSTHLVQAPSQSFTSSLPSLVLPIPSSSVVTSSHSLRHVPTRPGRHLDALACRQVPSPSPVVVQAPSPSLVTSSHSLRHVPTSNHVTRLAILGAEASGAICPITTEPIRAATATMTPCGHIFDREALALWTATAATATVCPECRAPL